MVCCESFEKLKKLNIWRTNWNKSSKDLTQDMRDASGPQQKWSPWKGGCQEAILKEGKRGEKAELCQMTQEVD